MARDNTAFPGDHREPAPVMEWIRQKAPDAGEPELVAAAAPPWRVGDRFTIGHAWVSWVTTGKTYTVTGHNSYGPTFVADDGGTAIVTHFDPVRIFISTDTVA